MTDVLIPFLVGAIVGNLYVVGVMRAAEKWRGKPSTDVLRVWQHGLKTGLAQDVMPAISWVNTQWATICKDIIDRCVAPDMQKMAYSMLEDACVAVPARAIKGVLDGQGHNQDVGEHR
jgi:hypothetical protein